MISFPFRSYHFVQICNIVLFIFGLYRDLGKFQGIRIV
jgi:hypothetical protein